MGGDVKNYVAEKQPSNAEELWITVRDAWHQIPLMRWQDLIYSIPPRCAELIKKTRVIQSNTKIGTQF